MFGIKRRIKQGAAMDIKALIFARIMENKIKQNKVGQDVETYFIYGAKVKALNDIQVEITEMFNL